MCLQLKQGSPLACCLTFLLHIEQNGFRINCGVGFSVLIALCLISMQFKSLLLSILKKGKMVE